MNYCYYIFGLRLPFGLRFDLQSHPPNRLIKFLFVGSRTLLHLAVNTRDWTCTSKISAMLGTQNDCPACSNAGRTVI